MRNPWLAKNPFLSMWMSTANSVFGAARGQLMNEMRRQQAAAMSEAARTLMAFWFGAAPLPERGKTRRAKSR